jgi:hypothetical protein
VEVLQIVHHYQGGHRFKVVERGAGGDIRTAVVTGYGETLMAQRPHQRDAVARHRPF